MIDKSISKFISSFVESEDETISSILIKHADLIEDAECISGNLQGRFLEFISHLVQPKRILEIGTHTGYSAYYLSKGLSSNGILYTIEKNTRFKPIISDIISQTNSIKKIVPIYADFFDIIDEIDEVFDLVFIDADKTQYIDYYKTIFPKINSGGLMIFDNVFWYGRVLDITNFKDEETMSIHLFNEFIKIQKQTTKFVVPIRDGLLLVEKK